MNSENLTINITAQELMNVLGAKADSCGMGEGSLIIDAGGFGEIRAVNDRTGNFCAMAALEDGDSIEETTTKFIVEITIGGKTTFFIFDEKCGNSFSQQKQNAQDTFIRACSFIGVYVGFALVINPNEYLAK